MKKIGILNQDISCVVAGMGHNDMLVIGDAGLPIPDGIRRIDLAVKQGVPGFFDTLETILLELKLDKVLIARETFEVSPQVGSRLRELFKDTPIVEISHEELKKLSADARAVVRTGEFTPFANVILVSGVVF